MVGFSIAVLCGSLPAGISTRWNMKQGDLFMVAGGGTGGTIGDDEDFIQPGWFRRVLHV